MFLNSLKSLKISIKLIESVFFVAILYIYNFIIYNFVIYFSIWLLSHLELEVVLDVLGFVVAPGAGDHLLAHLLLAGIGQFGHFLLHVHAE